MWIDTHCHLDAPEFESDREQVVQAALQAEVSAMVLPAVFIDNCRSLPSTPWSCCRVALGLHPIYIDSHHQPEHLDELAQLVQQHRPIAIGEIGLDFFVDGLSQQKQIDFFVAQLKLAQRFDLPVILHVRRAQDQVLKYLRRHPVRGGIAHAFNGSPQQAAAFIELGFKLGFGGVMTFPRARQVRELAQTLPLSSLVLETDAPDIPPEWDHHGRNQPAWLPRIAQVLAELRGGMPLPELAQALRHNSEAVFGPLP